MKNLNHHEKDLTFTVEKLKVRKKIFISKMIEKWKFLLYLQHLVLSIVKYLAF